MGGASPILGGGATLSLLPLAGPWWQGSECPLPTPAQENLVPGPAARLLFEMSPVGGTLAWLRCSGLKGDGLYVKACCFPLIRFCFSFEETSVPRAGLAHVLPQGNPPMAPHCPTKAVPAPAWPQGLLGPGPGQAPSPSLLQTHRVGCTNLSLPSRASRLLLLLREALALSPQGSLHATSSRKPPCLNEPRWYFSFVALLLGKT